MFENVQRNHKGQTVERALYCALVRLCALIGEQAALLAQHCCSVRPNTAIANEYFTVPIIKQY